MTYSKFIAMEVPKTTFQAKMPVKMGNFARIIDKPEAKAMKRQIYSMLYDERPANIMTGPMTVTMEFFFQPAKARKLKSGQRWRTVKPDLDNLCKGFIDTLVKAEWIENDQSIVQLMALKWDAADPKKWGVFIQISEIQNL